MKLIAQLDNSTLEIYCDSLLSIHATVDHWKNKQYYMTEDQTKIIPWNQVKFFKVEK